MEKDEIEEAGIDPPSRSHRRSLRKCRTSSNSAASPDLSKNIFDTKDKRSRKRKNEISEDDASYSAAEDEDDQLDQQKKVPGYRCSPHLIPELMKGLNEKQKGWVKNMGFGSLLDMIDSRMPKALTMWLVDRVDTSTGTLEVCGIPVQIRAEVARILKLPCGEFKVPPPLNGRSKAKRAKGDISHPDQKHSDKGRGQTASAATKVLLQENEDEQEFCISFVMLVLCIYLAPTTSLNINRNYYSALMDVSKIKLMDWCGFVAEYLIQGIKGSRSTKASHIQVPGCVHILLLIYVDALIRFKALVLPEALKLPEGEPRIHFVGTEHLSYVASVDVKSSLKDHIEYGLLQESWLSSHALRPHSGYYRVSIRTPKVREDLATIGTRTVTGHIDEIFAPTFIESLLNELHESRQKIKLEYEKKLEDSDNDIFSKYLCTLVNQYEKTTASLSPIRGTNPVCNDDFNRRITYAIAKLRSLIPAVAGTEQAIGTKGVDDHKESPQAETNMTSSLNVSSTETEKPPPPAKESCLPSSSTTVHMSESVLASADIEQPGNTANTITEAKILEANNDNSAISLSADVTYVDKKCMPAPPSVLSEIEHPLPGVLKDGDSGALEEMTEVVKMTVEAADQATCNSHFDKDPKSHDSVPLSSVSDEADLGSGAKYDNSPIPSSVPTPSIFPDQATVIGSDPSAITPFSVKETPSALVPDSDSAPPSVLSEIEHPVPGVLKDGDSGALDEMTEVVKMAVEEADQATCNSQIDKDPKSHDSIPLSSVSDEADLGSGAKYDNSPVPSSVPTPSIFPDQATVIGSDPSAITPFSVKETPSALVPDSDSAPPTRGPALFDPSPATASLLALSAKPKVFDRGVTNETTSSRFPNLSDSDSFMKKVREADHSVPPSSPQDPPSLTRLLSQYSESSEGSDSESEDEDESETVEETPQGIADPMDDSQGADDFLPICTPDFEGEPSYTYDTQEVIEIPDDPINPHPSDIIHIPPLQAEIQIGFRFRYGGSVTKKIFKKYEKLKKKKDIDPLIADVVNFNFVLTKDANRSYESHILDSSARISTRLLPEENVNRQRTKIQIKGFHITIGEFVDSLQPTGEVCQTLMGLCSVAIMLDWDCKTKIILDQSIIAELLKDAPKCDHRRIAAKLKKLSLEEIELIYLPILENNHWILAVVNIVKELVQIYDSLLDVAEGEHPHKHLWDNLAYNLRESYCTARKKSVIIDFFDVNYPSNRKQTNKYDCGYHVIQTLECHGTEDLVNLLPRSAT